VGTSRLGTAPARAELLALTVGGLTAISGMTSYPLVAVIHQRIVLLVPLNN